MSEDLRELISKKRDGAALSPEEVQRFVHAAATNAVPEVQLAAMLMAIFVRGMTTQERTAYALAMMDSGDVLDWRHLDRPTVDKHSTGGVGDKVSLIWAPLMAAMGYAVPMISGRGLGHTGGTLDKLEAIPGYRTDLSTEEMGHVLETVGCVITGQTADLVPADRTLYSLRSRTATVASVDHIAPSILSKKLAEGAEAMVLDVKVGRGAFMKTKAEARHLAEVMVAIGQGAGRRMTALLTSMATPLGRKVGNALEVQESVAVLRGEGPPDLRELVLDLAEAAVIASQRNRASDSVRQELAAHLQDGSAMDTFTRMVEAQGGDGAALDDPTRLLGSDAITEQLLVTQAGGFVAQLDALDVGLAVAALGGARQSDGSPPHPGVGAELLTKPGDRVHQGQPWARLFHTDSKGLDEAIKLMESSLVLSDAPSARTPLVLGQIQGTSA
ncbi:MAG TPA: thymidine phosphorylase [Deltaproteobacteria bacterium]|nr:thymidine phosphorylase [Deltaproteobacteria bacterium]